MYTNVFTSTLTYTQAELHASVKGYQSLVNKMSTQNLILKPIAANAYVQITDEFQYNELYLTPKVG